VRKIRLMRLNARLPQIRLIAKTRVRLMVRVRVRIKVRIMARIMIN
jgi:hypothetical protein